MPSTTLCQDEEEGLTGTPLMISSTLSHHELLVLGQVLLVWVTAWVEVLREERPHRNSAYPKLVQKA